MIEADCISLYVTNHSVLNMFQSRVKKTAYPTNQPQPKLLSDASIRV